MLVVLLLTACAPKPATTGPLGSPGEAQPPGRKTIEGRPAPDRPDPVEASHDLARTALSLLDSPLGALQSRGALLAVEALRAHADPVTVAAAQRVISQRRAILWDRSAWVSDGGRALAFSPYGERLLVAGGPRDATVLLNSENGEIVRNLGPGGQVVSWSDDPSVFAVATRSEVRIHGGDGAPTTTPLSGVSALAWSTSGALAAGHPGGITLIGMPKGAPVLLPHPASAPELTVRDLAWRPDSEDVAWVLDLDNPDEATAWQVNVGGGGEPRTVASSAPIDSVAYSLDGLTLAVASQGTVRLYDADTLTEVTRLSIGSTTAMGSVGFGAEDGLVAAVPRDGPARLWWTQDGIEAARLGHEGAEAGAGQVTGVALDPTGRFAATIGHDRLRVWALGASAPPYSEEDSRSRDDLPLAHADDDPGGGVAYAHFDQREVVAWEGDQMFFRDERGGTAADMKHPARVAAVTVSHDGTLVGVIDEGGSFALYDAPAGRRVASVAATGASHAAVSRAGVAVAVIDAEGLQLYRLGHGSPYTRVPGADWAAFSPGGSWVAVGSAGVLQVRSVATGDPGLELGGEPVSSVLFSLDDRWLALGRAATGQVQMWDLDRDRLLLETSLGGPQSDMTMSLVFDDRVFEVLGRDAQGDLAGRSSLWRPDDLIAEACATVVRPLTPEEWTTYLGARSPRPTCPEE